MAIHLAQEMRQVDDLIRRGRGSLARRILIRLVRNKIPRENRLPLASLCRRADLPDLGLGLLNALVRPTGRSPQQATSAEKSEYAATLTYIGAAEEAMETLQEIDPAEAPQSLLFMAFAQFAQWDYANAIPVLNRYLSLPRLGEYDTLVGKANLASALVYERQHDLACSVLKELREASETEGRELLLGKALELSAQNSIGLREWSRAAEMLDRAHARLAGSEGLDEFFVRKWKTLMEWSRKIDRNSRAAVKKMRREAFSRGHWETIRDCDRYLAVVAGNESLFLKVYMGTPFPQFRKRLLADFGRPLDLPAEYLWCPSGSSTIRVLGVLSRPPRRAPEGMKEGMTSNRLLRALVSDFYRPFRSATLHSKIFPKEYYNPNSSPARVREAIHRLRNWLSSRKVPLKVVHVAHSYHLSLPPGCGILVPREPGPHREKASFDRLLGKHGDRPFSARQAGRVLQTPLRSVQRTLRIGLADRVLDQVGRGPKTQYRFKPRKA